MIRVAFWGSLTAVVGTYLVFPLATVARSVIRPRPYGEADVRLLVSVVIAAHNEAGSIADKIDSVLASTYDPDLLDVVVAADGCTDATEAVVAEYADRGVRLLALPRVGKAAALNAAIASCRSEILVLTDASGSLAPDAVAAIVRPFADPSVGGVAGDQRYSPASGEQGVVAGERSYWSLDRILKVAESRGGNVISATGSLYAVRRSLADRVIDGATDDFYLSTGVIARGHRLVFARDAVALDEAASSSGVEYGRKVRIMTRGLHGVLARRELLDPRRHGYYSVQLFAHKILRRVMVFPLLTLFASTVLAGRHHGLFRLFALGQGALYGAGLAGMLIGSSGRRCPRALALPAYFCLVNLAALRAVSNVVRGRRIDRWEPARLQDCT